MRDESMVYSDLESVLMRRRQPQIPEGLSERIIAAMVRFEEDKKSQAPRASVQRIWSALIRDFSEMLYIPRPAYVFATLLVMGISVGTYSDYIGSSFLPGVTTDELSSFMKIEDRFVASEFLSEVSL
jgi:hypothetical protein